MSFHSWVHEALFGTCWCVLLGAMVKLRPRGETRVHMPAVAVLALHVLLAASMRWTPAHIHAIFVQRASCAVGATCDLDGPWAMLSGDILGALLMLWPGTFTPQTHIHLLFAIGLVALAGLYALVYAWMTPVDAGPADRLRSARVATLALALVALNPLAVRLFVSGTFWMYSVANLLGGLLAVECWRRTKHLPYLLVAAALLGFATLSNYAVATWVLVPPGIALLAWPKGDKRVRWSMLAMLAVYGVIAGPGLYEIWHDVQALGGVGQSPIAGLRNQFLCNPLQFPWAIAVFATVGLGVAVVRTRRWVPLVIAFVVCDGVLAAQNSIGSAYPSRFGHAVVSFYALAAFAALAIATIGERFAGRAARRRWYLGAVASVVVTGALASEMWTFVGLEMVVSREHREIVDALTELPEHDHLWVLTPTRVGDRELGTDPVEVAFSASAWSAVVWGGVDEESPDRITASSVGDAEACVADTLVYVGSAARSWVPAETESALFHDAPMRRPVLDAVQQRWRLEPVHVFELSSEQDERVDQRLAGDRVPSVAVGFYRLVCDAPEQRARDGGVRISAEDQEAIMDLFEPVGLGGTIAPGWQLNGVSIGESAVTVRVDNAETTVSVRFDMVAAPEQATDGLQNFSVTRECAAATSVCEALIALVRSNDRAALVETINETNPAPSEAPRDDWGLALGFVFGPLLWHRRRHKNEARRRRNVASH